MPEKTHTDHPDPSLPPDPVHEHIIGLLVALAVLTYSVWVLFAYWILFPPPIRHALYWVYFIVWITGCYSLIGLMAFQRWWIKLAWFGTTLLGWAIIFGQPAFLLPPPPFSGDLLADALWKDAILAINVPESQDDPDPIRVLGDHRVAYSWRPDPYTRAGRTISLNDDLWVALDTLRQTWCATLPSFPSIEMTQPVYEVAVQCR